MLDFTKHQKDFERMIGACNLSENTKRSYHSDICVFFRYFKDKQSIKHINSTEVLDWLLTYDEYNTRKAKHNAVKWFYKWVINQKHKFDFIPYGKKEKRLPIIIDQIDVQKLFDVCDNLKHKAIMSVLYSTGIRISELIGIKLSDIESKSEDKAIRIIGKGNKERLVPLSDSLHQTLKIYYRAYKPAKYLFENPQTKQAYSVRSVQLFLNQLKVKAKVVAPVTPHKFRHSAATSILEAGTDILYIKELLGRIPSLVN